MTSSVKSKTENLSFSVQLALCAVRAAVRPFCRCKYFALAIVIPNESVAIYEQAAAAFMYPDQNFRIRSPSDPVFLDSVSNATATLKIKEAVRRNRAIIIVRDINVIPEAMHPVFDAIAEVSPPTRRQISGIIRKLYHQAADDYAVETIASTALDHLNAVMRDGRPLSRVVAALKPRIRVAPMPSRSSDEEIDVRLDMLSGYGEAKEWGLDLARDIADWRSGKIQWHDVDKGVLLSGPPGTGKTIFAKALAATCEIDVVYTSAARWQGKGHLGDFLKAMQRLFDEARQKAPCILFIDEVDSMSNREDNHGDGQSYVRQAVNGFLECLDGSQGRDGVVVVGACNNPGSMDPAILRAGRLDHHIRIELPDEEARVGILQTHLRGDLRREEFAEFARESRGLSGADIAKVVRKARRSARRDRRPLDPGHILNALPPSVQIPKDRKYTNALHEIGHAIVGVSLGVELVGVSIANAISDNERRQVAGLASFRHDRWARRHRQHYLDRIAMLLGGIAAEQLMLGNHDDGSGGGAGSDLNEATRIAITIENHFGMGEGLLSFGECDDAALKAARYDRGLMVRAETILRQELGRAKSIIEPFRYLVHSLTLRLLERSELDGIEVMREIDRFRADEFETSDITL